MSISKKDTVLNEVLSLSPLEKAEIIENLLESFEFHDRKEIDKYWADEAEKRIDEYECGSMKTIPADKVFDRINSDK